MQPHRGLECFCLGLVAVFFCLLLIFADKGPSSLLYMLLSLCTLLGWAFFFLTTYRSGSKVIGTLAGIVLAGIFALYWGFALFGNTYFFDQEGLLRTNTKAIMLFLWLISVGFVLSFWSMLRTVEVRIVRSDRTPLYKKQLFVHGVAIFFLQSLGLLAYRYLFGTGFIGETTYRHIAQALRLVPWRVDEGFGYAQGLAFLWKLFHHLDAFSLFQVVLYLFLSTAFWLFLIRRGLLWWAGYGGAIVTVLFPATAVLLFTPSAETTFALSFLACVFLLVHFSSATYFRRLYHIPCAALAFGLLGSVWSYGLPTALLGWLGVGIYLFFRKEKKPKVYGLLAFVLSLGLLACTWVVLPSLNNAQKMEEKPFVAALYHGYAGVYAQGNEAIYPSLAQKQIEAIAPKEALRAYYNPYSMEAITANVDDFSAKLARLSFYDACRWSWYSLKKTPQLFWSERLHLSEASWSVGAVSAPHTFPYPLTNHPMVEEKLGLHQAPQKETYVALQGFKDAYQKGGIASVVLWRGSLAVAMIFLLWGYGLWRRGSQGHYLLFFLQWLIVFIAATEQNMLWLGFAVIAFPFYLFFAMLASRTA